MIETALPFDRAREELDAARALLDASFPTQALTLAAKAALHGAEAALIAVGEPAATPAGTVAAFTRRAVVEGDLEGRHARALRGLFQDRLDVEQALAACPPEQARLAIGEAELLVEAAARWAQEAAAREARAG